MGVKTWQVYVTSELKMKVVFFVYFTQRGIIFIGVEKRYLPFSCTKILNNSKRTKASRNEVTQPITSNKRSTRPIVPHHIHEKARFGKSVINGRRFIYLGISKIVQDSISIRAARKANIWLHAHYFR